MIETGLRLSFCQGRCLVSAPYCFGGLLVKPANGCSCCGVRLVLVVLVLIVVREDVGVMLLLSGILL